MKYHSSILMLLGVVPAPSCSISVVVEEFTKRLKDRGYEPKHSFVTNLATPRIAGAVCGGEINVDTTLTADLECLCRSNGFTSALTIKDGATLNLNGFDVFCDIQNGDTPTGSGIVLEGQNAGLKNGSVYGFSTNIQVGGSGHTITNMVVTEAINGITLTGNDHSVSTSSVGAVNEGISIAGNGMAISDSIVSFIMGNCLSVTGNGNEIASTTALDCPIGIDLVQGMSNSFTTMEVNLELAIGDAGLTCINLGNGAISNTFSSSILGDCINPILVYGSSNVFSNINANFLFGGIQVYGNSNQFTRVNIDDVIDQSDYDSIYFGPIPCLVDNSCPSETGFEIFGNLNILSDVSVSDTHANGIAFRSGSMGNRLENSQITRSGDDCVEVDGTGNTVLNTKIIACSDEGIDVASTAQGNTITGNDISLSDENGIEVDMGAMNNIFTGNKVSASGRILLTCQCLDEYFDVKELNTPNCGTNIWLDNILTTVNAPSQLCVRQDSSPMPSRNPSSTPSKKPSSSPSKMPSKQLSSNPSKQPSSAPSSRPSTKSKMPSSRPSSQPSVKPSKKPSTSPSKSPVAPPDGFCFLFCKLYYIIKAIIKFLHGG